MRLHTDSRGQSIQIGAVLIFAVIIILLSLWQAVIVPNQNADVEFDHYQTAERDMIELRSAIQRAKTTGEDSFATVQLGTEFSNRVIARNPPDPTGSLRTSDNKTLRVEDGTGTELDLIESGENRFIEYRPNYAEYQEAGRIRYENTVVYSEFDSNNIFLSNQRLLRGDTVSLIPLHQEFQASGKQTVPIEPIPGVLETNEEVDDPTVTIGTELSEADWEELLEDEIEAGNVDPSEITVSDGNLTLDLTGSYDIEYAPVGLDRPPTGGERGSGSTNINPAAPGDIRLVAVNLNGGTAELTFRNTADEANAFASGRVAFYDRSTPDVTDVTAGGISRAQNAPWPIPSGLRNLDPNIELAAQSDTTVDVVFSDNINAQQEWFVMEFKLESGEVATYFVGSDFDST